MTRSSMTPGTSLTFALALAGALAGAPAGAQLLGGGLGGAVGLPGAMIGGAGDIGVTRIERGVAANGDASIAASRRVRQPATPRTASASGAISAQVAPASAPLASGTATVRAAAPAIAGASVSTRAVVRNVPELAVRRTAIIAAGIAPVVYTEVPGYIDRQYVVLQGELRGTGVNVQKRGEQIVLDLPSDVNFAFDKSDIQPRFLPALNAVSRVLAHYPATYVDVNGHTDAIGSYGYNQALSERRADAVADYLADRSVNPVRLHVQGFGKTEPIASNATIQGRAANRRVEIVLTPVEG